MTQWEIYDYPFATEGIHPVVIISPVKRVQNDAFTEINGLFCRSIRPTFQPKEFHFVIDQADGLDNATVVRCDHVHVLLREHIGAKRGVVSRARRLPLFRKIMECYGCPP